MIGAQTRLFSEMALLAAFFYASLSNSIAAQEIASNDVIAQLQCGSAQDVARVIASLTEEPLGQDDVVGQLTLMLDDDRIVQSHMMGQETVRDRAWSKLFELKPTSIASIMRRVPDLESNRARGMAFEVIAQIGKADSKACSQLLGYCHDEDVYVRSRAISALSAVGDNCAMTVNKFGELLHDSDPMVRWTVLDALDKRHDRIDSLVPTIIDLLDDESDVYIAVSNHFALPEKLQGRAARLLAKVGPEAGDALPKLKRLMRPEFDSNVRIWAATARCTISDAPPPDALRVLGELLLANIDKEHVRNDAPEAIMELGARAAPLLDHLERARMHASPSIRCGVVRAFFAVDPASAVSRVLPMIDDKDELVAETVIEALSARKISEPAVIDAYIRALGNHDGLFDQPASSAVDALASLGVVAKPAIPALERLSDDPNISDALREDVDRALAKIR